MSVTQNKGFCVKTVTYVIQLCVIHLSILSIAQRKITLSKLRCVCHEYCKLFVIESI